MKFGQVYLKINIGTNRGQKDLELCTQRMPRTASQRLQSAQELCFTENKTKNYLNTETLAWSIFSVSKSSESLILTKIYLYISIFKHHLLTSKTACICYALPSISLSYVIRWSERKKIDSFCMTTIPQFTCSNTFINFRTLTTWERGRILGWFFFVHLWLLLHVHMFIHVLNEV